MIDPDKGLNEEEMGELIEQLKSADGFVVLSSTGEDGFGCCVGDHDMLVQLLVRSMQTDETFMDLIGKAAQEVAAVALQQINHQFNVKKNISSN